MIIKSFEINKINFNQNKLVLFYGKNEGFKNEATSNLIKDKDEITKYEEKEVLENINDFIESILSKSLFYSTFVPFVTIFTTTPYVRNNVQCIQIVDQCHQLRLVLWLFHVTKTSVTIQEDRQWLFRFYFDIW